MGLIRIRGRGEEEVDWMKYKKHVRGKKLRERNEG